MCVVVDTNCIHKVFNRDAQDHAQFAPVFSWIMSKDGRIVYGGTEYAKELRRMPNFAKLFQEYGRQGKIVRVDDPKVDAVASFAKKKVGSSAFNDAHLVGIVAVSHCRVICTDDKKAIPYLKRPDLYKPTGAKAPKIYSQKSHLHLCAGQNVVSACRS